MANENLKNKLKNDPKYRKNMYKRHPELADWVENGSISVSPSGFTWHHSEKEGLLLLVDRMDHNKNHGIYHPFRRGGRAILGGGKLGRIGKLDKNGKLIQ